MKMKRLIILIIIAVLFLSGCQRPASKPPESAATPTVAENFPLPGTDVMGQLELFATQTAQAQQGGGPLIPTALAPTVILPTVGPTSAVPPPPAQPTAAPQIQPTSAPAQAVEIPKFEVPRKYTLQKGEYIYCIARRFDVNPSELLSTNGLGTNQTVYAGTQLTIPQTGNSFPGNRSLRKHPATYTVQAGDTLNSIACLFGDVDPRAIAAANGIKESAKLSAGDKLQIP